MTIRDKVAIGAEGGFWITRDLRAGLGYSFKSADEIAAMTAVTRLISNGFGEG